MLLKIKLNDNRIFSLDLTVWKVINDLQRHMGSRNQTIIENTEEGISIVLGGR